MVIDIDINTKLNRNAQAVNDTLHRILDKSGRVDGCLRQAIAYTLEAGGKRLRSTLVLWCCEIVSGGVNHNAEIAAAAIEMVHTYSLIHDDLPAMDDDDFRRGRPTCHKAFDEATAILAGDALLTLAFEILSEEIDDPVLAIKLISRLALAAGPAGMIAGQMADLRAENSRGSKKDLEYIHTNKTAKMFGCAAAMGAIAGRASQSEIDCLYEFGLKIGLGFQIADDILDICAPSEQLGKTTGKDEMAGKMTYPALIGIAESKKLERQLADEAVACLKALGPKADILRQLATSLLQRTT